MKRFCFALAILLCMCFFALGEDPVYELPVDFSGGYAPNPSCFTKNSYEDASLSILLEKRDIDRVRYDIAWVKVASPTQLRTEIAGKPNDLVTALPTRMAKKVNAVLAVNGDFYSQRKDGMIYRMGTPFRLNLNAEKDTLIIDEAGDFHIFVGSSATEILEFTKQGHTIVNAFTFGPALIKDGEILSMPDTYRTRFDSAKRSPRTVIAQTGTLEYVFVEVEGRNDESIGATTDTTAQFMAQLGVKQAYCLDGGNSSIMIFHGRYYDSNYTASEREQSDIVYFATAVPESEWK